MSMSIARFEIGKNGINPGVIESLYLVFKTHKQVRVSFLKSSGRDRESITKMADEIVSLIETKKEFKIEYRIIGFTIIMLKYPYTQIRKKRQGQHL